MVIIKLLTISTFTISIFNIWVILHFLQLPYFASPEIWRILFDFRQLFHYEPKYSKVVKSIKFIELTCESMPQLVFTCYIQAYLGPSEELLDNIKTYTSLVFSFLAICIGIMDVVHTGTIHKWHFCLEYHSGVITLTQEATDTFDPHGKLLGSNYIFPNPCIMWSPKIPIKGLA